MSLEEKLKIFKEKGYTYDPVTGLVTSHKGKIIKNLSKGYIQMGTSFNNIQIRITVGQYGWYIMYDEVPNVIDHCDRNKTNNKIYNLRNVTSQQNSFNTDTLGYYKRNDTKSGKQYISRIHIDGKTISLGCYNTPEEAHQAYLDAKKIYHII